MSLRWAPTKTDGDPQGGNTLFLRMCFYERNPNTRVKIDVSSCFRVKSFGSSYECIKVPTVLFPST